MANNDLDILLSSLSKFIHKWETYVFNLEKKGTLKDLCVALTNLEEQYEQIDALRKKLAALYDKLNESVIPQAFENAGLDKIAIPELGHSFYPLPKYSASIVKGEEYQAFNWLRDQLLGSLITETVNRNTLAATLKDRLINENLDPPDCMKLTKYVIIGSSKYTPKGK